MQGTAASAELGVRDAKGLVRGIHRQMRLEQDRNGGVRQKQDKNKTRILWG
jgi:hypothetical protein